MSMTDTSRAEALHRSIGGEPYTHPQPDAPVAVREYRIAEGDGVPCLFLTWALEDDVSVDGFRFAVEELDAAGDLLETLTVTCEGSDIPPVALGECFVAPRAIRLPAACADVRIRLLEVESAGYVYKIRNGRAVLDYAEEEPWCYAAEDGVSDGLKARTSLRVRSKLKRRVRFLWPAALLTFLLLLLAILAPSLPREKGEVWLQEMTHPVQDVQEFLI